MTEALVARFSRTGFSNYDGRVETDVHCSNCGRWHAVSVAFPATQPGSGGFAPSPHARAGPFVLTRHLRDRCACGADILVVLTGGAGGRHGEEQYGVAGLRIGSDEFR